jgi:hypothetical protein
MASIVVARQGLGDETPEPRRGICAPKASQHANRGHEQIAREIRDEPHAVDREQDERYGKA